MQASTSQQSPTQSDRHQQPVRVSPDQAQLPLFLGVDVGGTSIKLGIVDDLGRTLAYSSLPTESDRGPVDAVERIRTVAEDALASIGLTLDRIEAVGLGTPGTMDIPRGLILDPPNLPGWQNFPIRDTLSESLGLPVAFANDGGAAAFGESWVGSGRDFHSLVMLTLGTGVGGGIIIGEMSVDGENSHGSECGHMLIDPSPNARVCGCGRSGHLEAYASATGLIKRTREALDQEPSSLIHQQLAEGATLCGLVVGQAAEQGDPLALRIVMETADYIALGITTLVFTIDPGAVIIGGAMTFGGESEPLGRKFLARIDEGVRNKIFPAQAEKLTIKFASLGSAAGYIGAAGIARVAYHKTPCP